MFDHVIVSVDGGPENRAALAPASDLAWRCGAKVVMVSSTPLKGSSGDLLKGQAMARSSADVDFWVDPGRTVGEALLETVAHRSAPIVVLASRRRSGGLLRRSAVTPLPVEVLQGSPVPMLVVGPETEVAGGLPLGEVVVPIDGSPSCRHAALLAAHLARALRLGVQLLVMVPATAYDAGTEPAVRALSEEVAAMVPGATCEVVQTDHPAAAVVAIAGEIDNAAIVCPRGDADRRHPLGELAVEVVRTSPRAVVLPPLGA